MIIKCPCGQKNRLPSDMKLAACIGPPRIVCGKCKREFTEQELMIATMSGILGRTEPGKVNWKRKP